jgi:hypothetical protein
MLILRDTRPKKKSTARKRQWLGIVDNNEGERIPRDDAVQSGTDQHSSQESELQIERRAGTQV